VVEIVDRIAVDGDDNVAADRDRNAAYVSLSVTPAQAGLVGRPTLHHLRDQYTVRRRKVERRRQLGHGELVVVR